MDCLKIYIDIFVGSGLIFFAWRSWLVFSNQKEIMGRQLKLLENQKRIELYERSKDIIYGIILFIEKITKGDGEIDYDEILKFHVLTEKARYFYPDDVYHLMKEIFDLKEEYENVCGEINHNQKNELKGKKGELMVKLLNIRGSIIPMFEKHLKIEKED